MSTRNETADRFRIEASLGSGTSGAVYRAYDQVRQATVAIKVLRQVDAGSLFRFKGEFRQLAHVSHRNLLQLHELTARGSEWVLSMELIEGCDFLGYVRPSAQGRQGPPEERDDDDDLETLSPEMAAALRKMPVANTGSESPQPEKPSSRGRRGQLEIGRLYEAMRQLAEGLHALHAHGHLHRDLKPANVLVSESDGRVVICDFGLLLERSVMPETRGQPSVPSRFSDTQIGGTLAYMSPEQAQGTALTEASDWYAVGVMLYEALTGTLPYSSKLTWRDAIRARAEPPVDPHALAPDTPDALAELTLSLLRWEPSERPDYARVMTVFGGSDARGSLAPIRDATLVGRAAPLAQLHDAMTRSISGELSVAIVAGRSGMGKSALVRQFLAEVEITFGAIVLRGRCYEREELPYKALDPLMDALSTRLMQLDDVHAAELVPSGTEALSRMFPVLRRVPAILALEQAGTEQMLDRHEERRRAMKALRELCRRLTQLGPVVVYIDDLQWGDLDSGPLLFELLRKPNPPPLLLIAAYRSEDEERAPLLRALREVHLPAAHIRRPTRIELGPLDEAAMRELTTVLLRQSSDASAAVDFVVAEVSGIPLFARELAAYILAHGLQAAKQTGLNGVIESRIRALSEPARTLLSVISVAGRPERRGVIDEVAGLGEAVITAHHILEAQQLVQSTGASEQSRIETYHDKVRETAHRMLTDAERVALHAALARTIARRDGEQADPDLLLEHWKAANEPVRAATYAVRAAEKAERSLAFTRAAERYEFALEAGETSGEERRVLTEKLAFALSVAGRGPEAAEAFLRASEGANEERAAEMHSLATTQLFRAGLLARGYEELQKAEHLLGMRVPATPLAAIGMLLWRKLRIRLLGLRLRKPRTGELLPALRRRMDLLWGVAGALAPMDQLRGGVYQAEHMMLALRSGDKYRFARALAMETTTWATGNKRPDVTQRVMDLGLEMGGASREPHALSAVWGTTGVCRLLEGRFLDAIRLIRQSQEIQRERLSGTFVWDRVVTQLFEMRALALLGRVHELTVKVPELLRDAEERGDLFAAVSLRTSHCCWAWLGPDQPAAAKREVEIAERQWAHGGYHLQSWYATQAFASIALYEGRVDEARARLSREWRAMLLLRKKIQFTRAEVLYLRGRLDLAAVSAGGDRGLLAQVRKDARALLREKPPWIVAHGRLLSACADSFDAPAAAIETLYEVEGQFEAVDMRLSAAVCAYRRGQLLPSGEGAAISAGASEAMIKLGVTNVKAFARMLAPGFPGVSD